jgi:hypothetical protein
MNDHELDIYVNHWPSRREGLKKTEIRRITASETLVKNIRSKENYERRNIVILGDFNDLPSNISLSKVLGASGFECGTELPDSLKFINLSYAPFQKGEGTYKYRDHWNMLDQMIISRSLADKRGIDFICGSFEIIKPEYIIQKEGRYSGTSLPTYGGRKYLGGYSDHFSIGAKFEFLD